MGLEERLRSMKIDISVADGAVNATMMNRRVILRIAEDYYDSVDVDTMCWDMSRLLDELFSSRRNRFFHAVSETVGYEIKSRMAPPTPRHGELRMKQSGLILGGASADGSIVIESIGLTDFRVVLEADTLEHLESSQFQREFESAVQDLWLDHHEANQRLRRDLGLDSKIVGT